MTQSQGFIEYVNGRISLDEYLNLYPASEKHRVFIPAKRKLVTINRLDLNAPINPVLSDSRTEWLDRDPYFGRLW